MSMLERFIRKGSGESKELDNMNIN
jgi:hypothetical protein